MSKNTTIENSVANDGDVTMARLQAEKTKAEMDLIDTIINLNATKSKLKEDAAALDRARAELSEYTRRQTTPNKPAAPALDFQSSDDLISAIVKGMQIRGDAGWVGLATKLLDSIVPALFWMRDKGRLHLTADAIVEYIALDKVFELADERAYPDMPPSIRRGIRSYLWSLPNFFFLSGKEQSEATKQQHYFRVVEVLAGLLHLPTPPSAGDKVRTKDEASPDQAAAPALDFQSSDDLISAIVKGMQSHDSPIFAGRATMLLRGVIPALLWMRDKSGLRLTTAAIGRHLALDKVIELADERAHPDMPPAIRQTLHSYLSSLPGFSFLFGKKQSRVAMEQHGFLTAEISSGLAHLYAPPSAGDKAKAKDEASPDQAAAPELDFQNSGDLVSAIVKGMQSHNSPLFAGRATMLLRGVIPALFWMRDRGGLRLTTTTIREHLALDKIFELVDERAHPDMPPAIRWVLYSYLSSLPGFSSLSGKEQSKTTKEQHGILTSEICESVANLPTPPAGGGKASTEGEAGPDQAAAPELDFQNSDDLISAIVKGMQSHDSPIFAGRATMLLRGVIPALFWMRDRGGPRLTATTIGEHLALDKIFELVYERAYPGMPPAIRWVLDSYLSSLPGFSSFSGKEQSKTTKEQHGILTSEICESVANLPTPPAGGGKARTEGEAGPDQAAAPELDFQNSDDLVSAIVKGMQSYRNPIFSGRAMRLLNGIIPALFWMRENRGLHVTADAIVEHLALDKVFELVNERAYPGMPPTIRRAILVYLWSLPGFSRLAGKEQSLVAKRQHAILTAEIGGSLANLPTSPAGGGKAEVKEETQASTPVAAQPDLTSSNGFISAVVLDMRRHSSSLMAAGRARLLLGGLIPALFWAQDNLGKPFSVGRVVEYLALNKLMELTDEDIYPAMPKIIRHSLLTYLESTPGFSHKLGENQSETTKSQHGFLVEDIQASLSRVLLDGEVCVKSCDAAPGPRPMSSDSIVLAITMGMDRCSPIVAARARMLLNCIIPALCWLRDNRGLNLNTSTIGEHLALDKAIEMTDERFYPAMPPAIRRAILNYLETTPGFLRWLGKSQPLPTREQHELVVKEIRSSLDFLAPHLFADKKMGAWQMGAWKDGCLASPPANQNDGAYPSILRDIHNRMTAQLSLLQKLSGAKRVIFF